MCDWFPVSFLFYLSIKHELGRAMVSFSFGNVKFASAAAPEKN
jgi:hypothetical protein